MNLKSLKRRKALEYKWAFKASFYVHAYTVKCNNEKTYVVYAHDFNDMEFFLTRLSVKCDGLKTYSKDCFDHFEDRVIKSYLPDKDGEPKKKPFWYRGRVYEIEKENGNDNRS